MTILRFIVDGAGNLLDCNYATIVARDKNINLIQVIAPFTADTRVFANIDVMASINETRSEYLIYKGKYDKVPYDNYSIFEAQLSAPNTQFISRHSAGSILISLSFSEKVIPPLARNYKGKFNLNNPLPMSANDYDYYEADGGFDNDFYYYKFDKWVKGDVAYWYNGEFRRANYKSLANMPSEEISVSPSIETNMPVEDDDPLILTLAGDVAETVDRMGLIENEVDYHDNRLGNLENETERLEDEKVNKSGDTMTGTLVMNGGNILFDVNTKTISWESVANISSDGERAFTIEVLGQVYWFRPTEFDLGYKRLTGVNDGIYSQDAVNKGQLDSVEANKVDKTITVNLKPLNADVVLYSDDIPYANGQSVYDGLHDLSSNKVDKTTTVAGLPLIANISADDLVNQLREASVSLKGLMSSSDKAKLNDLWAIFDNGEDESFVDTITELLAIFSTYPEGIDIIGKFAEKADKSNVYDKTASDNRYVLNIRKVNGKSLDSDVALLAKDIPIGEFGIFANKNVEEALELLDSKITVTEGVSW